MTNSLGKYLKDCRARLDPASLGLSQTRRRTPGLRREEVAQRANISATWYAWLEQGRGGSPSAQVLGRIAQSLLMTKPEREHLFMLAFGHLPEVLYSAPESVSPRLQRILDTLAFSPAFIRTATWDVLAWNNAAAAVFTDYSLLPPEQRNIMRLMFCNSATRAKQDDWYAVARFIVAAFRADATRAGAASELHELADELCTLSVDFATLWRDNDVRSQGEGTKRLRHPDHGLIELEYSSFAVDGRPDLSMIVYNPVATDDAERVQALVKSYLQR
ncbi:putative DNA-binding protein [Pseudomonas coronafaciens pv. atropurpurea]|uniref:helix-turn-helix transcriptional regulator n=1 Tax=Pseudomonas coronafaciens TaxID=53409 RepID=UPI0006D5D253|nr:helix-turn-helix transcriptional regulator [Pseudomonas coronafaciens]KPW28839.1 DNA-binding protein [Pseudomonas coronafaciens pv. atropurpurea]RMN25166.1 putative DNA-binding protein [Pseudomonas coronafaciens pv. zizaniae]RMT56612.1 putative DNA-binding protein [Pseudomonas coronafaciens pv. atropurpurea]RMV72498.1 DNA-binding protein [Pseudomonas coronafaciens pv. atropurpurea]